MTGTVLPFDPLRAALERRSANALAELERAAALGRPTPELAEALERFAEALEATETEACRLGLASPRRRPDPRYAAFVGSAGTPRHRKRSGD